MKRKNYKIGSGKNEYKSPPSEIISWFLQRDILKAPMYIIDVRLLNKTNLVHVWVEKIEFRVNFDEKIALNTKSRIIFPTNFMFPGRQKASNDRFRTRPYLDEVWQTSKLIKRYLQTSIRQNLHAKRSNTLQSIYNVWKNECLLNENQFSADFSWVRPHQKRIVLIGILFSGKNKASFRARKRKVSGGTEGVLLEGGFVLKKEDFSTALDRVIRLKG